MRAAILCMLPALACAAETAVAPPSIGLVHDCQGNVRRIFGTPGAFVLGPPEAAPSVGLPRMPEGVTIEGRNLIVRRGEQLERIALPETTGELQSIARGWVAATPFLIRLTADRAILYRLPMKGCSGALK